MFVNEAVCAVNCDLHLYVLLKLSTLYVYLQQSFAALTKFYVWLSCVFKSDCGELQQVSCKLPSSKYSA